MFGVSMIHNFAINWFGPILVGHSQCKLRAPTFGNDVVHTGHDVNGAVAGVHFAKAKVVFTE